MTSSETAIEKILDEEFTILISGAGVKDILKELTKIPDSIKLSFAMICVGAAESQRSALSDKFNSIIAKDSDLNKFINDHFSLKGKIKFSVLSYIGHALFFTEFRKGKPNYDAWVAKMGSNNLYKYDTRELSSTRKTILEKLKNKTSEKEFSDFATAVAAILIVKTATIAKPIITKIKPTFKIKANVKTDSSGKKVTTADNVIDRSDVIIDPATSEAYVVDSADGSKVYIVLSI